MNPPLERRPRAVIFDMDGLMLDTEPLAARAWSEAARRIGIPFDAGVALRLVGRTFSDCRTLIVEHHGTDYPVDPLMEAWHAAYDGLVEREGIAIKPGLAELLDWLETVQIPKAVATSTRHARARAKLVHTKLLDRFVALVGGDEVERGKPHPDILFAAARRLDCPPGRCLVLEDSEPGFRAAVNAGMASIVVPDLCPPPYADPFPAPRAMASLHEVRRFLSGLPAPDDETRVR